MELHTLYSKTLRKTRKRVGRGPGSGNGKTAGKGHKGAKARSGYKRREGFEGGQNPLYRRLPKRGFFHRKRQPMAIINVDMLEDAFEAGATIDTAALAARHLVRQRAGGVKLLGRGDVTKAFTIRVQAFSPSAKAKIEAAGGSTEIVPLATSPAPDSSALAAPPSSAEPLDAAIEAPVSDPDPDSDDAVAETAPAGEEE